MCCSCITCEVLLIFVSFVIMRFPQTLILANVYNQQNCKHGLRVICAEQTQCVVKHSDQSSKSLTYTTSHTDLC